MTGPPFQHLVDNLPAIVIEQWTGIDGWPEFRVIIRGSLFGFEDDGRHVVRSDYGEAHEVARILAEATGFPITVGD